MNGLHERLSAAIDSDGSRFDGAAFAEAHIATVRAKIARRRAARSAAVGGASLVGAGLVAVGATQVPWSGLVPSLMDAPRSAPGARADLGAAAGSPFQCGYVFVEDEWGTEGVSVAGSETTDTHIHEVFDQWYGDQEPTTEVGETGAVAYHASMSTPHVERTRITAADPATLSQDAAPLTAGMSFVAVKNHEVVGFIPTETNGAPGLVVDADSVEAPLEAFLWDMAGMTPCGSVSIEGAEIYAVAGLRGDAGVSYAWTRVSE